MNPVSDCRLLGASGNILNVLLTNLLYYDYKCLCFINLLAGHYRINGALIQGIIKKKWSFIKKKTIAANFTRSLEFCFVRF